MVFGYARVSTAMQARDGNSIEDQRTQLMAAGCEEIIEETYTGKTTDRPKFNALLKRLKSCDTMIVCKLDRFARTTLEGIQTIQDLFDRGVKVNILNMGMIEDTLTGRLILQVLLAFAEYERGMIVERTQSGKSIAKQNPSFREGRPRKFSNEQISHAMDLLNSGYSYNQVSNMTGISVATLARAKSRKKG